MVTLLKQVSPVGQHRPPLIPWHWTPPEEQQTLFPGAHSVDAQVKFAQHGCPGAPQATQVLLEVSQTWPDVQSLFERHWTQVLVEVLQWPVGQSVFERHWTQEPVLLLQTWPVGQQVELPLGPKQAETVQQIP